jgi:aryl-alcohol dehydrogenase-like predicted oxidoreductase
MRQRLLLGTAQWGLDYGVTNGGGRIPDEKLADLVNQASRLGIEALDTAPAYGDSETRIRDFAGDFAVQTKVSAAGRAEVEILWELETSRKRIGRDRIWGVLVHDWPELSASERSCVMRILEQMRHAGAIDRFGVSIYQERDLEPLLNEFGDLNVVQIPTSVIDQRLRRSEALTALRVAGVAVQARSIFLQGILLNWQLGLESHPELASFGRELEAQKLNALSLCVDYICAQEWIDEVVVGVTSSEELKEIHGSFNSAPTQVDWECWASTDEGLIDPRTWSCD